MSQRDSGQCSVVIEVQIEVDIQVEVDDVWWVQYARWENDYNWM